MTTHYQRLETWLRQSEFDGVLVSKPENIGYLTDFWGSFGLYLQTRQGRYLLTDGRYAELVQALAVQAGFEFVLYQGGVPAEFVGLASGTLAVEDTLTVAQLKNYRRWFKGVRLKSKSGVVEALRRLKNTKECDIMRQAQAHVDQTLVPFLQQNLRVGITERQLKWRLDQALQAEGQYGLSFDSIVGFGPGSALPHYISGERQLAWGDNILIDCGIIDRHYCSDMTRNFVFGSASDAYLADYGCLLAAQKNTLNRVKAGVKTKPLDVFCRNQLGDLAELFTHSLGHGVGVEIHEAPTLSSRSKERLQVNEVVTIEPGIYRPGQYGIRIEDSVIVQSNGCQVLTQTTKDLLSFGEEERVPAVLLAA